MKFLIPSILLLISVSSIGASQSASNRNSKETQTKEGLELTNVIVVHQYCSGGGVLLILKSKYRNTGNRNLILFRHALPPFEYRISRSKKAALSKRYEQVISPLMGSGPSLVQFGDELATDYFVVLKPGQTFTPVNTISVPVFTADTSHSKEYLAWGTHVLQLKVSTWPFDSKLEDELRVKWQHLGTLWTRPILSLPMSFHIERFYEGSLSNCNH